MSSNEEQISDPSVPCHHAKMATIIMSNFFFFIVEDTFSFLLLFSLFLNNG